MYVGAWQEYKLMKVIEDLREENERLRRDAAGSPDGLTSAASRWGVGGGQGSSHHFPASMGDVRAGGAASVDSATLTHVEPTASAPRSGPRRGPRNPKPKTLRLMTTVRDVGVFVEEEAGAGVAPLSSSASVASRSCSEGTENKKTRSLSSRDFRELMGHRQLYTKDLTGSLEANSAAVVHAEIGTGRILGASHQRAPPPAATDAAAGLLPSLIGSSQVRENPLLRELLRGAPLDTKTKYQQAGQPLPERKAPKNSKKGPGLSEEEVQRRVERRLRLQMLYTGNLSGAEHVFPDTGEPLKGHQGPRALPPVESEEQAQQPTGFTSGTGQAFPSVPWDCPASKLPLNTSAEDGVTPLLTSTALSAAMEEKRGRLQRVSSPSAYRNRLRHPYDVGAPLAPPSLVATLSCGDVASLRCPSWSGETAEGGDRHDNSHLGGNAFSNAYDAGPRSDVKSVSSAHNELNMPWASVGETIANDEYLVSAGRSGALPASKVHAGANLTADPMDDDTIGMLINWAEQLDPDSIV
ncbi:uncharacterized protein Tco025E_06256 [Trypanosoma conorhini]|uniref:Uncharacterized protein n=1 Tax=Trypanosoma conorhini TaxID=83891 RepID=A0A3R7NXH9_9TRYP|nr:uncharacterized protein Tco025E_06256 [Trypanosoma conorhini]RNF13438.1 hypothetical protein Tco025E_06256 [Trypanosoma conorhini]